MNRLFQLLMLMMYWLLGINEVRAQWYAGAGTSYSFNRLSSQQPDLKSDDGVFSGELFLLKTSNWVMPEFRYRFTRSLIVRANESDEVRDFAGTEHRIMNQSVNLTLHEIMAGMNVPLFEKYMYATIGLSCGIIQPFAFDYREETTTFNQLQSWQVTSTMVRNAHVASGLQTAFGLYCGSGVQVEVYRSVWLRLGGDYHFLFPIHTYTVSYTDTYSPTGGNTSITSGSIRSKLTSLRSLGLQLSIAIRLPQTESGK